LGKGNKLPSPCIDVCKDKRDICVGCGRTKKTHAQREALILECAEAAKALGIYEFWAGEYRRKCRKKGRKCPLDAISAESSLAE